MSKFYFFMVLCCFANSNSFSQDSVNDYKYIIVPAEYEFLKEADKYQLNSLTKFLFNKYGYTAYLTTDTFPSELRNGGCLGLVVDLVNESNILKTKLRMDLKDCTGKIIMSSGMGESREKKYEVAYNLALRDAFKTYQQFNYSYKPNDIVLARSKSTDQMSDIVAASEQEEINRLKEELKALKEETAQNTSQETVEVVQDSKKEVVTPKVTTSTTEVLYAQAIDNGYQLVDSTPKVVMVLMATGATDVYTVNGKRGIVFKKNNQWLYSENDGSQVIETVLNIKF